jgi:hypothetical protein
MREYYRKKIEELKTELKITQNQFNMISGTDIADKNIDILILRMNILEKQIDNIYVEAKLKLM